MLKYFWKHINTNAGSQAWILVCLVINRECAGNTIKSANQAATAKLSFKAIQAPDCYECVDLFYPNRKTKVINHPHPQTWRKKSLNHGLKYYRPLNLENLVSNI